MAYWSVADVMEFARALRQAGDCFVSRRMMQRLDDESLGITEATAILRDFIQRRDSMVEYDPRDDS